MITGTSGEGENLGVKSNRGVHFKQKSHFCVSFQDNPAHYR